MNYWVGVITVFVKVGIGVPKRVSEEHVNAIYLLFRVPFESTEKAKFFEGS